MINIYYSNDKKDRSDSYVFLRQTLCGYCGVDGNFRLMRTKKGKPYIEDYHDIHFSITHTGSLWMCAVSDAEIGIDAEYADRRIFREEKITERFFSEEERRYTGEGDIRHRFLEIWTRKEAYLKLRGDGIFNGMEKLCTLTDSNVSFIQHEIEPAGRKVILAMCSYNADMSYELTEIEL
jgi:4'-phosphopantetheinyl transferase